ncbi:MAG: ATP-binding cassette domain-containing protein [Alphaproteobacteria bacterium]|nr:ATP-binding cassette domain-containing protein [Alphaproteobacteria bacterium]
MAEGAMLPLAIDGIRVSLGGRRILDEATARIATPGVTAVIGPNGAGKSVLLRAIDGLLPIEAGAVRFGDRRSETVRRGFVFQDTALIRASVADNVALALQPLGLSRGERARRVAAALELVGLGPRAREAARRLSGGERQRLGLARARVVEPELLLLDEPTASLDPGATEEIERIIRGMAADGVKVVVVSHNLGQVARLAEDVVVVDRGRLVEHGPVEQVLSRPRSAAARAYLAGELPWLPSPPENA